MFISEAKQTRGHALKRGAATAVVILGMATAGGCEGLLDVSAPGNLVDENLRDPAFAPNLVASAQNQFECAYTTQIVKLGLWSGYLWNASTHGGPGNTVRRLPSADNGGSDCRESSGSGGEGAGYGAVQAARGLAKLAIDIITEHEGLANKDRLLATANAYLGYATIYITESYCEQRLDPEGPVTTPSQAMAEAANVFATARTQAQAAGATDILNLARVGGARALIWNGKGPEAKALAEAVPMGFEFLATYDQSSPRRWNRVYERLKVSSEASIAAEFRGLMIDGMPDPRVPVYLSEIAGGDGSTPVWATHQWESLSDPIAFARWAEAQLIIAEAELLANNVAAAVAAINRVRATWSIGPYAGGTAAEVRTQLIEERRRELHLQGHRFGDMIRFNIPFPEGPDHKGMVRSAGITCMPLPDRDK